MLRALNRYPLIKGDVMDKKDDVLVRRKAISEIVSQREVQDQHELVDLLSELYGIKTNQSVVSRDLRVLGINKRSVGDMLVYTPEALDCEKAMVRRAVKEVVHNNSVILIKTEPGFATMVSNYLENGDLRLLGTLAGENTVFVVPVQAKEIKKLVKKICTLVGLKK